MPHRSRVLVVDDKREDGEAVVRRLWDLQIPCYFLHYSDDNLINLVPDKAHKGIRFIFQDIALVTTSTPDNKDYSAALTGINKILAEQNGPWLLVAWSTWAEDPEEGTKYAQELFNYLQRLPEGKKPYDFVVLDKTPFCANGLHSDVKTEHDFSAAEREALLSSVQEKIETASNLALLNQWEHHTHQAAANIVNDLWDIVNETEGEDKNQRLGAVLFGLAVAEGGSAVTTDKVAEPLYQLLSKLHYDKSNQLRPPSVNVEATSRQSLPKEKLNTMLHWDAMCEHNVPGSIFRWPFEQELDLGLLTITQANQKEFIKDAFLKDNPDKYLAFDKDQDVLQNTSLVLLDITPACDHAQKKAFWRRLLVGIKVFDESKTHFYVKNKLPYDNLRETPVFVEGERNFRIIFNSKLVVSLTDHNEYQRVRPNPGAEQKDDKEQEESKAYSPDLESLKSMGRIRDELLKEIQAWYGRMATRPGIVRF